jgi:hypothetical protein
MWANMRILDNMKTAALPSISAQVELYEMTFMVLVLHAKLRVFRGMLTVVFTVLLSEKYGLKHK